MKKHKILLCFLPFIIALIFVFQACHNKEALIEFNDLTINEAKSWFSTEVVQAEKIILEKSNTTLSSHSEQQLLARMGKLERQMEWPKAYLVTKERIKFIIVPVSHNKTLVSKDYDIVRSVVFSKLASGKIEVNIIEILGTKTQGLKTVTRELTELAWYNKVTGGSEAISGVEATVFFYDGAYQNKGSFSFKDGKWTISKSKLNNRSSKYFISSGDTEDLLQATTTESQNCATFYVVYDWYNENGELVDWEILYSYQVCDGGGGPDEEEVPEGGGSGGENGLTASIVKDSLSNPCIKAVFDKISSTNLSNTINALLSSLGDDRKYVITFKDNWTGGNAYSPATTQPKFDGIGNLIGFDIKMNGSVMSAFSQELIAEIMHHEIVHAFMNVNDLDPVAQLNQHYIMLKTILDDLVRADREVFPNYNLNDAYGNALWGLSALLNYSGYQADAFNLILSEKGFTITTINEIYQKYSTGSASGITLGTRCE